MANEMHFFENEKQSFLDFMEVLNLSNKSFSDSSIVGDERSEDMQMALSRLVNTDICFPAELFARVESGYGINLQETPNRNLYFQSLLTPETIDIFTQRKAVLDKYKAKLFQEYKDCNFSNSFIVEQVNKELAFATMIFNGPFVGIAGLKLAGKSALLKALTGLTVNLDKPIPLSERNKQCGYIQFYISNSHCPASFNNDSVYYFDKDFNVYDIYNPDYQHTNILYNSKLISLNTQLIPDEAAISIVFCDSPILEYFNLVEFPGLSVTDKKLNDDILDLVWKKASFVKDCYFLSSSSSLCFKKNEEQILSSFINDGLGGSGSVTKVRSRAHLAQDIELQDDIPSFSLNKPELNEDLIKCIRKKLVALSNKNTSYSYDEIDYYRTNSYNLQWFYIVRNNNRATQEQRNIYKNNIEHVQQKLRDWKPELINALKEYVTSIITDSFINDKMPKKPGSKTLVVNRKTLDELADEFYLVFGDYTRKSIWDNIQENKYRELRDYLFYSDKTTNDIGGLISDCAILTFPLRYYSNPFYDTLQLLNSADRPNAKGIQKVLLEGKDGKPGVIERLVTIWETVYGYYENHIMTNMARYKTYIDFIEPIETSEIEKYDELFSILKFMSVLDLDAKEDR